jgi:uncharacterized protein YgiM (DUF1202 family)
MARSIPSILLFAATLLVAGAIIAAGAVFTVERLADAAAAAPVKTKLRPSYVASLPPTEATDLDIARFVPVEPDTAAVAAAPEPPRLTHEVAVDSLWVRAAPNKRSARLLALARGVRLAITRSEGNWLLVSGPNGGRGWVYSRYLRKLVR